MVGIGVMTITVFAAGIFITNTLKLRAAQNNMLNLNVVREQLISIAENQLAWSNSINHNAALGCFLNVINPASNDCASFKLASPATYPFPDANKLALYDSQDLLVFNSALGGTNGLDLYGRTCNTFSVSPGDPNCPLQPTISFRAVCPTAGACINPPVVVRIDFLIANGQQLPSWLNPDRYSAEIFKMSGYCPTQANITSTLGSNTSVTAPTLAAPYLDGSVSVNNNVSNGIFLYTTPVYFCARTEIRFQPVLGVGAATRNRVCLGFTNGSCEYEWLETSDSAWVLRYNGVQVYSVQPSTAYPALQSMKFLVQNGSVSFYSDDSLLFHFQQTLTQTFIPRFMPSFNGGGGGMNFDINSY